MRPVFMDVYAVYFLTINITTCMIPFVYYEASLATLVCQISKSCTEKPGTYYKIVISIHLFLYLSWSFVARRKK